ncbi:MAG: SIMPL domain-containing protein [Rhodospirillales bacterium]|nr:SIMPL domain-containing protein [Rhodospirillales bacterium]
MTFRWIPALFLVLLPAAALAAPATMLHLTQSATVLVKPDDFVVGFAAQADAADPAAAQARVNTLAAAVLAEAGKVKGAQVDTGAYGVWHQANPDNWHASQTITVHGADAVALLKLAGAAQAQGVTVQQLGWRLSPQAELAAEEKAQVRALAALKTRAQQAAQVLGLHVAYFREVTLGPPPVSPGPRVLMALAAPGPGVAPVAAHGEQSVSQSVSAVAVLEP